MRTSLHPKRDTWGGSRSEGTGAGKQWRCAGAHGKPRKGYARERRRRLDTVSGQEGKPPRERSGPAVRLSRDKGMAWGQQPVTEAGMLRRQPGVAAEVQASLFSYYVLSGGPGPAVGLQVQQGLIMGMGSCNCGG